MDNNNNNTTASPTNCRLLNLGTNPTSNSGLLVSPAMFIQKPPPPLQGQGSNKAPNRSSLPNSTGQKWPPAQPRPPPPHQAPPRVPAASTAPASARPGLRRPRRQIHTRQSVPVPVQVAVPAHDDQPHAPGEGQTLRLRPLESLREPVASVPNPTRLRLYREDGSSYDLLLPSIPHVGPVWHTPQDTPPVAYTLPPPTSLPTTFPKMPLLPTSPITTCTASSTHPTASF